MLKNCPSMGYFTLYQDSSHLSAYVYISTRKSKYSSLFFFYGKKSNNTSPFLPRAFFTTLVRTGSARRRVSPARQLEYNPRVGIRESDSATQAQQRTATNCFRRTTRARRKKSLRLSRAHAGALLVPGG